MGGKVGPCLALTLGLQKGLRKHKLLNSHRHEVRELGVVPEKIFMIVGPKKIWKHIKISD